MLSKVSIGKRQMCMIAGAKIEINGLSMHSKPRPADQINLPNGKSGPRKNFQNNQLLRTSRIHDSHRSSLSLAVSPQTFLTEGSAPGEFSVVLNVHTLTMNHCLFQIQIAQVIVLRPPPLVGTSKLPFLLAQGDLHCVAHRRAGIHKPITTYFVI